MAEGSSYQVLFVRRTPRRFGATYGPIRHDPGTVTIQRDYLELEGQGVQHEGWRALRIILPFVVIGGPLGALLAYFLIEYALAKPTRFVLPLIHIQRVVLDPLRGTVMIGAAESAARPLVWHSFATAYAWAIFDHLEPLIESGKCGLVTRRDRALAKGDLAMFLAVCALVPGLGGLAALAGVGAGLAAAALGQRRYGLAAAALCLLVLAAQAALVVWWLWY